MQSILQAYQELERKAREANLKREGEIRSIHDEIINRYRPGGSFLSGSRAELEQQKVKDVGKSMQQLISSGLFGTTRAATLGTQWEADVGAPARAKLEDISMERLSQAQAAKAGFVERIEEPYPDYGALTQAAQAQASKPRRTSTTRAAGRGMGTYGYGGGSRYGGRNLIAG